MTARGYTAAGPAAQAKTANLGVRWADTAAGSAVDVTGQTVTITRISDAVVVVGPTATGIVRTDVGRYSYEWPVPVDATVGDYAYQFMAVDGVAAVEADGLLTVSAVTTAQVGLDEVLDYLTPDITAQWINPDAGDDDPLEVVYPQIQDALNAEKRTQARKLTFPSDDDPDGWYDINDALKRRVQRNLAMRALPLALGPAPEGGTPARLSAYDPEIKRFEGPYRKRTVG